VLFNQFALPLPSERVGVRLKNKILMFPIPQFTEGSLYILPCGKSVGKGGEREAQCRALLLNIEN